jgi:hypothetical protein
MATHFTGSGDRLSHSNSVIAGTANRSFSVWVRKTSSVNNSLFQISYGSGTWLSEISTFGGDLFVTDASSGGSAQYTFTFTVNQWYHIGYTYDGTNKRVYVDGALVSTQAWSSAGAPSGDGWIFGAANFTAPDADLQDITIWDVVLTADEIAQLFRQRLPRRRNNLVAHYPLFPDAARTADYSGNGRTLTSAGTPTEATSNPSAPWTGGRPQSIYIVSGTTVQIAGSAATNFGGTAASTESVALVGAAATAFGGSAAGPTSAKSTAGAAATAFGGTVTVTPLSVVQISGVAAPTRFGGAAANTAAAALAGAAATQFGGTVTVTGGGGGGGADQGALGAAFRRQSMVAGRRRIR